MSTSDFIARACRILPYLVRILAHLAQAAHESTGCESTVCDIIVRILTSHIFRHARKHMDRTKIAHATEESLTHLKNMICQHARAGRERGVLEHAEGTVP